jgi:glycine/D-amino acid oxidase-like deaminating enzyme
MRHIFGEFAYGDEPRDTCWWDETVKPRDWPRAVHDHNADVCIIGAGYTGLNAALTLAEAGASVIVLDSRFPGWGASGRNGGFCCLGGAKISQNLLENRFGKDQALAYRRAERAAVEHVAALIDRFGWDVDRHSSGETELAHSAKAMAGMAATAKEIEELYGCTPTLHDAGDLPVLGMGGVFHGGLTIPIGFGLNPRKYLDALATAATTAGARIFGHSRATGIVTQTKDNVVETATGGRIKAQNIVFALNGYADETLSTWLRGRYMPTQSNVLVTRPLEENELAAQGWTSAQMAYDSQNLLHYFRLMPDRRFLFGLRGGLRSSPNAEGRARRTARRDFERMFPAWSHVESTNAWSGMVCLSAKALPFCGPIPDTRALWTAFAYHGNGVAMGSYLGSVLGKMISGTMPRNALPRPISEPPRRWPLGRFRRLLMPPLYAALAIADL